MERKTGNPATLTFRCPESLRARLRGIMEARGLQTASEAVKAAILEASMDPVERKTVPARDELLELLGREARSGSVTAMKALLEEHRRDGNDEAAKPAGNPIDELAARRSTAA